MVGATTPKTIRTTIIVTVAAGDLEIDVGVWLFEYEEAVEGAMVEVDDRFVAALREV
jgi:hypothetical protein